MRLGFNGKGGFIQNFILPAVVIIGLVFAVIIGGQINSEFNNSINAMDDISDVAKETNDNFTSGYNTMGDSFTPIVLIVYIIISVLSAIMVRMSPVFTFVTVFLMIGLLILPMLVSNIYGDFIASDGITVSENFPVTNFILTNFPFIYIGYIIITALAWIYSERV